MRCLKLHNSKSTEKNNNIYTSFFTFLKFTFKVTTGSVKLYHLASRYYSRRVKMVKYNKKLFRADINISLDTISRMPVISSRFKKIGEVPAGDTILRCYKDGPNYIYVLDGYSYLAANIKKGDCLIFFKKMKYSGSFIKNALILFFKFKGLFALHSALVARKNTGILLVGDSGAGKTTLAVGLKKMGLAYECDDLCLIGRDNLSPAGNLIAAKGLSVNMQANFKDILNLKQIRNSGISGSEYKMYFPGIIIFLKRSIDSNHMVAVDLMRQKLDLQDIDGKLASLRRMLSKKSLIEYDNTVFIKSDAMDMLKQLERYYAWARGELLK